jgi:phenylpropionate dioxygenase-like ring-hydroxylating dioxygenase large terminal subunit
LFSKHNWYLGAYSNELKVNQILPRTFFSQGYVLFRTSDGQVHIVAESCPHKAASFALGKIHQDSLVCAYHGWKFDREGNLNEIPNLESQDSLPRCRLKKLKVIEQDGFIWFWPKYEEPTIAKPPTYPQEKDLTWIDYKNEMKASMDLILENGLDSAHTGFVHSGLFRGQPSYPVKAQIEKVPSGIRVTTIGELAGGGKTRFSWGKKSDIVSHTDEFIVPHTVFVDYAASGNEMLTYLICTPISDSETHVFTRMGIKWKTASWIKMPISDIIIKRIIQQDKRILENQQAMIEKQNGERHFVFSKSDRATQLFYQVFKRYHSAQSLWRPDDVDEVVSFRL